jgi:hypothetical protein
MKILLTSFFATLLFGSATSHSHHDGHHYLRRGLAGGEDEFVPCGTRHPSSEEKKAVAEVMKKWRGIAADQADGVGGFQQVDTWVHIIRDGDRGNLGQGNINQMLQHLNDSFGGTGFSFTLRGTTNTDSASWYWADENSNAQLEMKQALRKGGASTLNLYVKEFRYNLGGYATLPYSGSDKNENDGVVISSITLPGSSAVGNNEGDTAVHEVGHWLGLEHVFSDGFGRFGFFRRLIGCFSDADGVDDTPRSSTPTRGCPRTKNSCLLWPGSDPINNFMDYSNDRCASEFTKGQVERMQAMWMEYRA